MTTSEQFARHFERESPIDCNQALRGFKKVTRQFALFNVAFLFIGILELFAFVLFFSFLTQSTMLAFSLAALFFTAFSYFVLLFYLQAKKPQQLMDLRSAFIQSCQTSFPIEKGTKEFHTALSYALQQLLGALHGLEYRYYSLPAFFQTLSPLMEKFSAWAHWKDLHQMKEILLLMIIKEQIDLVKLQPTDLQSHANLASAYASLAKLYLDPRKLHPEIEYAWVSPHYASKEMGHLFRTATLHAIEELKILHSYAPGDLRVHAELANLYHSIAMPQEEMRAYEAITTIAPDDQEALFRLGVLYFEHGRSADALRLYERLQQIGSPKAEELISYYDATLESLLSARL